MLALRNHGESPTRVDARSLLSSFQDETAGLHMTYPVEKAKVRVFTWIILGVNILALGLLILQISNVNRNATNCGTLSQGTCNAAKDVGTTIGAGLIIALWVALDVILGVLWLVTRRRQPQVIYLNQGQSTDPTYAAPPAPTYQAAAPIPTYQHEAQAR